ncbi:hypothetical protein NDU88_002197 [Pleurodeles waltl]|uniref:Uncharacterized protein n=1 Tax=Pleurodeles waltl TaxID=8319 RepID=A0AAV7L310_PLEWA|nr:hypothetical protein NDU88_002197 [Pleurodeles waltl]
MTGAAVPAPRRHASSSALPLTPEIQRAQVIWREAGQATPEDPGDAGTYCRGWVREDLVKTTIPTPMYAA